MNDKKKFNWSMIILTTVVTLFPILIGMYLYNELPENLPGHFNFKNEVDRYDPKWVVVFIYPSVMALLHFVLCVGTSFQMRKFEKENKIFKMVRWIIPVITNVLFIVTISVGMGQTLNVGKVAMALVSAMLIFIGNYLPKMTYEEAKKTINILPKREEFYKEFSFKVGYAFVIGGILALIVSFIDPLVGLGIVLGDSVVVAFYSIIFSMKK